MTDLHCHILPGIDDGAKDVSVSLELLHKEYEDGVRNIAFTSHFNSERTTVEAFLEKRAAAYARLTEALKEEPMDVRFKLGSEVYVSPKLCELDAKALCMGDTAYMLIEFPTTHKPHFIRQTLYALQEQGILPLGAFYLGTRQVSLSEDKQIKTPEDLNGINLRMPNSDAWVFLGKAMGANPTAIPFNDLYLALQTGTVDGQDNPLPTVQSAKFYEVQKSISLTNHLVDSVWPTINLNTWNKLTDTQKGWVMEAVEAGRKACDEQKLQTESEVQDFLKEQGLSIYEADVAAFADHVLNTYLNDPISDSWDKDLLAEIQAMA